ncbi:transposable element Tcb2 transposase [Trichonephila clavipes]|nr:transposable element Tcb2 transposase [Trichonephila clavipes]
MEDSESWRDVGRIEIETGQSITDVALFFGVHHSVILRLWKQFQTTQTVVRRPAISAATVRRRLHMNGLYAWVPRVCVPLSVQSRGARLKWFREHGNWTVSDWGNAMFTDESRFALERIRTSV